MLSPVTELGELGGRGDSKAATVKGKVGVGLKWARVKGRAKRRKLVIGESIVQY
jgi:hypothetical protein